MRVGMQDVSIIPRAWNSHSDLERFLEKCSNESIVLGGEIEAAQEFYSVSVCAEPAGEILCTVGLLCEAHGLSPEVLAFPESGLLFIGSNSRVSVISWRNRSLLAETDLDFLFRSFIPRPKEGLVLGAHETGIDAFSLVGERVWHFHRDVVEAIHLDEKHVHMTFIDDDPSVLAGC